MTSVKYIAIIDTLLDNYKYQTTEDGYTFIVEKREGLYCFHLIDEEKILQQFFPKEQVEAAGHKSTKITQRFYAHLEDRTVLDEVTAAFNS